MIHGRIPWTGYFNLIQTAQCTVCRRRKTECASNKVHLPSINSSETISAVLFSQNLLLWCGSEDQSNMSKVAEWFSDFKVLICTQLSIHGTVIDSFPQLQQEALSCWIHQFHCCQAAFLIRGTLGLLPPQVTQVPPPHPHPTSSPPRTDVLGRTGPTQISSLFLA